MIWSTTASTLYRFWRILGWSIACVRHLTFLTSDCGGGSRYRQMSSIWRLHEARPYSISWEKIKNPAPRDCADWCLVWPYQVSAHLEEYCRLWIDLKIFRDAPPERLLEGNGNSSSERLCGLISGIILPSFSSIGYELYDVKRSEYSKRRAPHSGLWENSKNPTPTGSVA